MIAYLPPLLPPSRRGEDLILRVDEAAGRYDRGRFVSLAHQLYRGDRRWVPPLSAARRNAVRTERNLLLAGAGLGAFLGIAQNLGLGDEAAGSIVAWPAPSATRLATKTWGSWGLFESINVPEMPERLFDRAENWLFEHAGGMTGIRGPLSLEPLAAPGLLTDGFDAEPVAFLPYNPPFYPEMVEAQGYEPGGTWRTYEMTLASGSAAGGTLHGDGWAALSTAYAAEEQARPGRGFLVPGLARWLAHLAGAAPFGTTWAWRWVVGRAFRNGIAVFQTAETGGRAAGLGIPDLAPALRAARGRLLPVGWLIYEVTLRRARRLRVFPAAAPSTWRTERLAELYAELARRAGSSGYRQMVIAPVSDEDDRSVEAMGLLGAHPVQAFTVYQKRF